MRLRHSDDTLLEGFVSCKSPTVTDVEGAGGTARPGRGAGRKWRAKAGGSGGAGRREIVRPARQKTPILGHHDHAGRTFSRTGRSEVVTVKPTTPLQPLIQSGVKPPSPMLAPEQHPLKPTTPMQPKNAPKAPNSHPQRRWRFQAHAGTHEHRRQRFQTSGPSGLQDPDAIPVGSGDTTATHISHVIYRGHFSRHPKNVAIPTTQIQCLNEP